MAGKKDMLAGLRHWAVSSAANKNSTVHLGGSGDHVFNVVSVAGAIDVRVVTFCGFVFDVGGIDRNAALFLFGSCVDFVVFFRRCATAFSEDGCDRGGECRFTVVNVADGANVDMRFISIELFFSHLEFSVCCWLPSDVGGAHDRD